MEDTVSDASFVAENPKFVTNACHMRSGVASLGFPETRAAKALAPIPFPWHFVDRPMAAVTADETHTLHAGTGRKTSLRKGE